MIARQRRAGRTAPRAARFPLRQGEGRPASRSRRLRSRPRRRRPSRASCSRTWGRGPAARPRAATAASQPPQRVHDRAAAARPCRPRNRRRSRRRRGGRPRRRPRSCQGATARATEGSACGCAASGRQYGQRATSPCCRRRSRAWMRSRSSPTCSRSTASALSGRTPDVQEADLAREIGHLYRLVVGPPGSRDAANGVCSQLKTAGYEAAG